MSSARLQLQILIEDLKKREVWNKTLEKMTDDELKGIEMDEAQEWFKLAEGPGMDPVSLSGLGESGIDYVPQRDITKTFPGAMSEEEDEYQKRLRAYVGPSPGLFKW